MSHRKHTVNKQTALLLLCGLLPCVCMAQLRDKQQASDIAQEFTEAHLLRATGQKPQLLAASSDLTASAGLTNGKEAYYIYSTGKDGFVIVSGDKRMPQVLAYSDSDPFDTSSIPPAARYWLDCYAEAFVALNQAAVTTAYEPSLTATVNPEGIAPLLGGNVWDQDDPFNRLCPDVRNRKCVTGCVATAMAQVMKYHSYPETGRGNISYSTETNNIRIQRDLSAVSFRWNDMLDDYRRSFTNEQANAVAELMYSCGAAVNMDYCTDAQGGSGSYQSNLTTAFVDCFGYDQDAAFMDRRYCDTDDWHSLLIGELNANRPVNYGGQSLRDGGHSFVIDGYRPSTSSAYPDYHVNWGWSGSCNGYYQVTDLHPVEEGSHATAAGFNNSQQMLLGVQPEDGTNEGLSRLGTQSLRLSSQTAKAGSSIEVYTATCANFAYRKFSGTLHVALISISDGSTIILNGNQARNVSLGYLQTKSNVSLTINLPTDLPDGQYQVQLCARQTGSSDYQHVYSKQFPTLNVSESGSIHQETPVEAALGCSELELVKQSDESIISLNIYELLNTEEAPFIGDLKMILADRLGNFITTFGDSIQPGELSMNERLDEPLKISGTLTGDWPDGDYRIYLGARPINQQEFSYVSFIDFNQSDYQQELFLSASINQGHLMINGHTYNIVPTSIGQPKVQRVSNPHAYSLSGAKIRAAAPGTVIIQNGKKKINATY